MKHRDMQGYFDNVTALLAGLSYPEKCLSKSLDFAEGGRISSRISLSHPEKKIVGLRVKTPELQRP
jgi:hypothetical protein